jgi:hypothetical protein
MTMSTSDLSDEAGVEQARSLHRSLSGPAWRWHLATAIQEAPLRWMRKIADESVHAAVRFLAACVESGAEITLERHQLVATTDSFWLTSPLRESFKILVLGGSSDESIVEQTAIDIEVVRLTRELFFDIEENRNASSWIDAQVMAPERSAGRFEQATRYATAYSGGPIVASVLVSSTGPDLNDEAARLQSLEQSLHLKSQAAMDMPIVDPAQSAKFTSMLLDFEHSKKRLEFEREKFRHRCEQDIREHSLAERRAEFAEEQHRYRIDREISQSQRKRGPIDRQKLAGLQKSLRTERRQREHQEAAIRATQNPLAILSWSTPKVPPQPADALVSQINELSNVVAVTQTYEISEPDLASLSHSRSSQMPARFGLNPDESDLRLKLCVSNSGKAHTLCLNRFRLCVSR